MTTERPPSFQEIIMRLERYWAEHGCLIWQPYSEKVGAGTMNPATVLRVLGPEPWNVAYVEPSYRADDGRYGENPNRMQMHTQYQVILKPEPGNPQELYLDSLDAIGIDRSKHDIRFVEDNWASPALGAWGLGWEVWLDGHGDHPVHLLPAGRRHDPGAGQRRTNLRPGAHRDVPARRARGLADLVGRPAHLRRRLPVSRRSSTAPTTSRSPTSSASSRCTISTRPRPRARSAISLVVPAHDYVLRCSQTFNLLDARGAVGVTERASYFGRMRDLARQVSDLFAEQRMRMEYPFLDDSDAECPSARVPSPQSPVPTPHSPFPTPTCCWRSAAKSCRWVMSSRVSISLASWQRRCWTRRASATAALRVTGTPRRLVLHVEKLAGMQTDDELVFRGPPASRAFDADGQPTAAAIGFARSKGLTPADLAVRDADGGTYAFAVQRVTGKPAQEILPDLLVKLISSLRFEKTMRWASGGVAFSRPLRWLVALLGDQVVPFSYANARSGRVSQGLRSLDSPLIEVPNAGGLLRRDGAERHRRRPRRAAQAGPAAGHGRWLPASAASIPTKRRCWTR